MNQIKNSTLIIPCVSIGNVPQLTVDLLVHNLEFKKLCSLNDEFLYPFLSPIDQLPNDSPSSDLSTSLELYYSEKHNLSLIQQRSPIIPGFVQLFYKKIQQLIVENDISRVFILDSGDLGLIDNVGDNIKVFSNDLTKSIESLSISSQDAIKPLDKKTYDNSKIVKYFDLNVEVVVLSIYVYEGENFNEAITLGNKLLTYLSIEETKWNTPVSWQGVYGDKPVPISMEEGIFG
ncbi:proteasome assembly chaperone 2 [[Candida] jaroonii]|uniref:Proteasome assembly chaperone 2 n=1 Tax=[Candida] jaroonii TaxID=467808 RepID=A0ACA9Y5X0_9ASCO|nr:proteasome assembly chaperone 2 [[Candida] jaroonii]